MTTAPANGSLTKNNRPAISGTAEANATVTIKIDGVTLATVIANGSGAWSYTPTVAQALNDGARTISASATDAAGNTGPSSSVSITVDTQAPNVDITGGPSGATNDNTPTFTFVTTGSPTSTTCAVGNQNVACSSPFTAAALSDGGYVFTVTVADVLPNGNLYVRGEKWLTLNQGEEYVQVAGIVRPADIGADNSVPSFKVADARITYSGNGVIPDANRPGVLARFFMKFWPL